VGLLETDQKLRGAFECERFEYNSRIVGNRLLTRVPTYRTVADLLRTRFERYSATYDSLVFVTHSQGGLVLQTFLDGMLADGNGASLSRIRRIILIACPNEGSAIFLLPRRVLGAFLPNVQERRLRPLNEEVSDVHRRVVHQISEANEVSASSCPIPVMAFAAESDAIVSRVSAYGSFRRNGVLPGSHKTVIRPNSHDNQGYLDLRRDLMQALEEIEQVVEPEEIPNRNPLSIPTGAGTNDIIFVDASNGRRSMHNLPQEEYSHFVGRERETQSLRRKLAPNDRTWLVIIDGIGGVGKTALAVEVARRLLQGDAVASPVFDAVIWSSAKEDVLTADGIRSRQLRLTGLRDIYLAICTVLGMPGVLRLPEDEQHAVIRQELSGPRRILLVVDNLESLEDEEVTSFLRELPQPAKAMVTSRHRIDVAYSIRLEGLRTGEAEELISQECERRQLTATDAQTSDLIRKTGGIPLAILWSIGLLGLGHTFESVLKRLGSGHSDIARFCFAESIGAIRGTPAERLLCALALLDRPARRELLGAAAGLDVDEVGRDDAIQVLLELSLVNDISGRISLLPLTAVFALSHLKDQPELAVEISATCLAALRERSANFGGLGAQWRDASLLADIGPYLWTAYGREAALGNSADALQFGRVHLMYLDAQGHWDEMLELAVEVEVLARSVSDVDSVIFCSGLRAYIHGQRGEFAEATAILDELEELTTAPEDHFQLALSRAQIARRSGNQRAAADFLDLSDSIALDLRGEMARMAQASVLFERGKLARDDEDWGRAKQWFEKAGRYFDAQAAAEGIEAGTPPAYDIERALGILGNLGFLEYRLGHPHAASELLTRGVAITRQHGPAANLVTLLQQLAEVQLEIGEIDAARASLDEALALAQRLRIAKELADCLALAAKLASR
jgi:tetratricopeptide (TPR) repeat protein